MNRPSITWGIAVTMGKKLMREPPLTHGYEENTRRREPLLQERNLKGLKTGQTYRRHPGLPDWQDSSLDTRRHNCRSRIDASGQSARF